MKSRENVTFVEILHQMLAIFCGDYKQTDLYRNSKDKSGLRKFHEVAKTMQSFTNIEFTTEDIVRSSLVKDFLVAVEKYENKESKSSDKS